MPIHLHIVSGCFHITRQSYVAATESCMDLWTTKYEIFTVKCYINRLLAPVLEGGKG